MEQASRSGASGPAPLSLPSPSVHLTGMARALALSVLEECTDALAVYQCSLKNLMEQPMRARRDADYRRVPTAREALSSRYYASKNDQAAFEMGNEEVMFEKLRQDSQWLVDLMHSAKETLRREGHLDVLVNEVARKVAQRDAEEALLARAREAQERLERTRREVEETRRSRKEEEERLRAELLRLRNEKEKLEVKSRAESEYTGAWLDSRREQDDMRAEMTRKQLATELARCGLRENNERLVSDRVEDFLRKSIQENEEGARNWEVRRQQETRAYQKDVHRLREEIEQRRAAFDELQLQYKSRQEFIDSCLAEKEAARRQSELEAHVRGCAVRIQAWWRGVMVRRKLGPYRPEEKKRKRPTKPKK